MLRTTPFHRENYARLILTVIIQFYQRCSDRFQTLITSQSSGDQDPRVALGAQWAQIPEMATCLSDLYHALAVTNKSELHLRERDAEARLTGDRPIGKEDVIGPMRNVSALCNLYRSVVRLRL
jgi:exocyst complex component 4